MTPGALLLVIGGEIGKARKRTCDRGDHSVHWAGLLGKNEIAWTGLLALAVRLHHVAGLHAVHGCIQAAFPVEYALDFVAGQLAQTEAKIARGEFVPSWRDLAILVPRLRVYDKSIIRALSEAQRRGRP